MTISEKQGTEQGQRIIAKFGGTSVGNPEGMKRAVDQIIGLNGLQTVAVVSALDGVTDRLARLAGSLAGGDRHAVKPVFTYLRQRHWDLAARILSGSSLYGYLAAFDEDFGELERFVRGIVLDGRLDAVGRDRILSYGERFGSKLFAECLRARADRVYWCDAHNYLITNAEPGRASPNSAATRLAVKNWLMPPLRKELIVVTQGFVGSDPRGNITTLGRGGSDYTATLLGVLLDAAEIQIWTDVDGVFTADPNKDPRAELIPEMTLDRAYQAALDGARVLYPPCLLPLRGKDIPLVIRNTFNPETRGTRISGQNESVPFNPETRYAAEKAAIC